MVSVASASFRLDKSYVSLCDETGPPFEISKVPPSSIDIVSVKVSFGSASATTNFSGLPAAPFNVREKLSPEDLSSMGFLMLVDGPSLENFGTVFNVGVRVKISDPLSS